MLVYVLKRVGLALVTLVLLSMIIFSQVRCSPATPDERSSGTLPLDSAVLRPRPQAGRRPAARRPVLELGHRDSPRAISVPPTSSTPP